jgi:hypothetical protein
VTDADQVRELELGTADGFGRCLRETRHLGGLLDPVERLAVSPNRQAHETANSRS